MYTLVYYVTKEKEGKVFKYEYVNEEFRLRSNALHYLREIVQNEYKGNGYTTEIKVGGVFCYKSKLTEKGERETEKILIKVEKA